MKQIAIIHLLILSVLAASAQTTYKNEWIDHEKTYYKIKLNDDGLYRISSSVLTEAGITANGSSLKMYHKGKEIPIYVSTDGEMSGSNYLEFYGQENDGELDSLLYTPGAQTTPFTSLFTDTSAYYLTIDATATNKRFTPTTNDITGAPPKEDFFIYQSRKINNNIHSKGQSFRLGGVNNNYADFEKGEGFVGSLINGGETRAYTVNTEGVYTGAGDALLEAKIIGRSNDFEVVNDHPIEVKVNDLLYLETNYEGVDVHSISFPVLITDLSDGNTDVDFTSLLPADLPLLNVNTNAVAYVNITYPHSFDFGGDRSFAFELSNDEDKYIEITNFNGGSTPVLYDLTNGLRFEPETEDDGGSLIYKFMLQKVEDGASFRKLFFTNTTSVLAVKNITQLDEIQFTDFSQPENQGNYIIISHNQLMQADSNYVEEYKLYRSSEEGGAYEVMVADVEELYDQFAWGILKHPLAIRNFINYTFGNWENDPQYLLLLGKSVAYNQTTNDPQGFERCLVPTYGEPPSDVMLTTPSIFSFRNRLATGRVPAFYNKDVKAYLDKLKEYDALRNSPCTKEARLWMKDAMHIAGGNNISQANEFINTLSEYEEIYEGVQFGGNVALTFNNLTDGAIVAADLGEYINNGLAVINFVGHSSGQYWSVDINNPFDYENFGKYPFVMTSSCFVGDIHFFEPGVRSMSEDYILADNLGAIGFLASATIGFPSFLDIYTNSVYQHFCNINYNQPIGLSIKTAIAEIDAANPPSDPKVNGVKLTAQEYSLAGDPAVIINSFENPEYIIEDADVFFTPPEITADLDSFALNVVVTNIGRAVDGTYTVNIGRTYPDGSSETVVSEEVPATIYRDTLSFYIQTGDPATISGDNNFEVFIDHEDIIEEDCEDNNQVSKNLFILSDLLVPIAPCDFAIVNNAPVVLQASTGLPLAPVLSYEIQLDTTSLFNSPFLQVYTTLSEGGVINWEPDIAFESNTVYYWRSSRVPAGGEDYQWKESSFIYLPEATPGWNQSHFYQFTANTFTNIQADSTTQAFHFSELDNTIYAKNHWNIDSEREVELNGQSLTQSTCLSGECRGGLSFIVLKPGLELRPLVSERLDGSGCEGSGTYGNNHCSTLDRFEIEFHTNNTTQLNNLIDFIENDIADGYYVLVSGINQHGLGTTVADSLIFDYLPAIYDFFESIGISNATSIPTDRHFLAFGRKGDMGFASQLVIADGNGTGDLIEMNVNINSQAVTGSTTSPLIGPALQWENLEWEMQNVGSSDQISFTILGFDGIDETVLISNQSAQNINLDGIDATAYPFIRWEAAFTDTVNATLPQPEYFRVYFDRVPEFALDNNAHFVFNSDTLQQGETLHFEIALNNAGETDSDSLSVQYTIIDNNNNAIALNTPLLPPIAAGTTTTAILDYVTNDLTGNNTLVVEINPDNHQPEKFDFNNILFLPFFVEQDLINPILDVTFDGTHILDGDIVSANPEIDIRVKDENLYLALNDTSDFEILLTYPDGNIEPVHWNDPFVTFTPANSSEAAEGNNTAHIRLNPAFTQDGMYQLTVSAEDRSGNHFGSSRMYNVTFEIISTPMISNLVNYPNPFTSSTRFVFTLTGSEVPDFIKIQVMTVSGKVVREIRESELGTMHIGRNITEFAWDGTDEFGNELANGVYLYRVIARLNGENLDKYDTGTDSFFKKDIGKMYLMR